MIENFLIPGASDWYTVMLISGPKHAFPGARASVRRNVQMLHSSRNFCNPRPVSTLLRTRKAALRQTPLGRGIVDGPSIVSSRISA